MPDHNQDSMVHFGGALKSLDSNGRVGGYLVRFTDSTRKDLDGDYFDSESYLGARDADGCDTLFHHGIPLKVGLEHLADHAFAPMKTKRDDVGIFAEIVLNLADRYEAKVAELIDAGKLGLSSGAAGHTVKREEDGYLKRWIIAEGSITPFPCEPCNRVLPLKAFSSMKLIDLDELEDAELAPKNKKSTPRESDISTAEERRYPNGLVAKLTKHITDLIDDGRTKEFLVEKMAAEAGITIEAVEDILTGKEERPSNARLKAFSRVLKIDYNVLRSAARRDYAQSIKGMFEEALAERTPSRWELESVYCDILGKLASAASTSKVAGVSFSLDNKVTEATSEYSNRLLSSALKQINEYVDYQSNDGYSEPFYFKAAINDEEGMKKLSTLDLDDNSQLVVTALRGILNRFRVNHVNRTKTGRVLSDKNRQRISELRKQMSSVGDELQLLLDESTPMATEAEKYAAESAFLRVQRRVTQLGVTNGQEATGVTN